VQLWGTTAVICTYASAQETTTNRPPTDNQPPAHGEICTDLNGYVLDRFFHLAQT
jgi:hypothetical protein